MIRGAAKRAIRRAAGTRAGKDAIHAAVLGDPGEMRFTAVTDWPPELRGFEDLAFLFSSNQLSHGIASLQLDEAALLYRLARDAGPEPIVELGRFKGGSTAILSTAMPEGAELWSYDLHVDFLEGEQLDRELRPMLERYGLADRVRLIVGDSRTAGPPPRPAAIVFVDGDHSYDGARADYLRWRELVRPGGHLLFHDARDTGGYGNFYPGIARLVREIERDDRELEAQRGAGTIAHFVRR